MTPELDRLLHDLPAGIEQHPLTELRERRRALQRWEQAVSLSRRLAQGRLDILGYELARRGGETGSVDGSLLFDLPDVLAEASGGGGGRAVTVGEPGPEADELSQVIDAAVPPSELCAVHLLPVDQLRLLFDRLHALEQDLSTTRRTLHERIDVLQDEIGRRYRDGEASIESLLG